MLTTAVVVLVGSPVSPSLQDMIPPVRIVPAAQKRPFGRREREQNFHPIFDDNLSAIVVELSKSTTIMIVCFFSFNNNFHFD